MHRPTTLLTLSLALAAINAERLGSATPQQQQQQRHESVSSEPLTFSVAEPEPTDRERLLSEAAAIENSTGDDFDWDESADDEEFENMELVDMTEDWADLDEYGYASFVDQEDALFEDQEDGLEEDEADSTYISEDGIDFISASVHEQEEDIAVDEGDEFEMTENNGSEGGHEDVGEPLEFKEPIARKLRRLDQPKIDERESEERRLAEKEGMRGEFDHVSIFEPVLDENGEFVIEPNHDPEEEALRMGNPNDYNNRDLQSTCGSSQQQAKIQIITDKTGHETDWEIRRTSNNGLIARGPRVNTRYEDEKQYIGYICLNPGTYKFIVKDKFNDGMCGDSTGQGLYRFYLDGAKKFTSPSNCGVNWGYRSHTFTIRSANAPNPSPTPAAISSRGGCQNVKIQFKTDKFGKETSVTLSGNGSTHLSSIRNVAAYTTKTMTKCLYPGTYTLRLQDQDGLCCNNGQGWYKMYVSGTMVIGGGYFIGSKSHTIKIGSNWKASMGTRATSWLNSHNSRRRKYNGGKGYIPLRWSRTLASDATNYANTLANSCRSGKLSHASGIQDGENLARNQGSGSYAGQYTTDQILTRWTENEMSKSYPDNAHMTQVVWRATQYVGCGESAKNVDNGQVCRTQVCRYAKAGNCNVRNGNWRSEAFKDDTGCGRDCPREGCFS